MANGVFANGREIACKAGAGKSICAMPDVCLSPPTPPAGPIPIPYPNTGMASDTDGGSKNVKISGDMVMLKNSSSFKQSSGDEAATKSQGMGVMSGGIQGPVYFMMWSMDVKIEGENAVRHMDMTTGNHASPQGNAAVPWLFQDTAAIENIKDCQGNVAAYKSACKGQSPKKCSKACKEAQICILVPKKDDKKYCCQGVKTGHHLVEVHCFTPAGGRATGKRLPGLKAYDDEEAPTVCANSSRFKGRHGVFHAIQGMFEKAYNAIGKGYKKWRKAGPRGTTGESNWRYKHARDAGAKALKIAAPHCNEECIKKQLDAYHKDFLGENTPVRSDPKPPRGGKLTAAQSAAAKKALPKP